LMVSGRSSASKGAVIGTLFRRHTLPNCNSRESEALQTPISSLGIRSLQYGG
jgi:hypothetical protein